MPDPARTVVLAMLPACLAGIWFFGFAALKVLLLCTVSCVVIEEGWNKLMKRASTWKDGSAILTGILLGMNLNAGVPWWVCVLGGVLAIILGKQLFGGLGYNPFNPALVARVGLLIGLPEIMTTWNTPQAGSMVVDTVTAATPLGMEPGTTSLGSLLTGNVGGCLGETSAIALLIGGAILLAFKLNRFCHYRRGASHQSGNHPFACLPRPLRWPSARCLLHGDRHGYFADDQKRRADFRPRLRNHDQRNPSVGQLSRGRQFFHPVHECAHAAHRPDLNQ